MQEPLAIRMSPKTIDEIIGQKHILSKNSALYRMIQTDTLHSMILYGPPGTGKTTIARVISNLTNSNFIKINAVAGSKKDMENAIALAKKDTTKNTIIFVDEIHRFNKAQQDYLLPFVEEGLVILIGATTENPFHEVNGAIMSRSVLFELHPLEKDDIKTAVIRALIDKERGLGNTGIKITKEGLDEIAEKSNGDIRHALTILEIAAANAATNKASQFPDGTFITENDVTALTGTPYLKYDKDGDAHYDTISAFIKSMRGSDPDATLYYLARMILAGEDPKFIARRIMVHACEDVGIADPQAICVATNAALAAERVGFPEARIILAEAAVYVALAPKSNAICAGIDSAIDYLMKNPSNDIPNALRDAHYKSAAKLGHGVDYKYPHDYPNHWVEQQYLPDSVKDEKFYHPSDMGYEETINKKLNNIKNKN